MSHHLSATNGTPNHPWTLRGRLGHMARNTVVGDETCPKVVENSTKRYEYPNTEYPFGPFGHFL